MKKKLIMFLCFLLVGLAGSVSAATIDFDDGTDNSPVGNLYSSLGVTFTNTEFRDNKSLLGSDGFFGIVGVGGPTFISFGINNAVRVDFSIGITSVSISGEDVGENGMKMEAFRSDGTLIDYAEFYGTYDGSTGLGSPGNPATITISSPLISSILIYQPSLNYEVFINDKWVPEGMILDNLSFNPVPVPSTIVLLGFGILSLAGVSRRKK